MAEQKNLFYVVMEAEGDELQPFDDTVDEGPPAEDAPPADDMGSEPPEMSGDEDLSFSDDMGEDENMDDTENGEDNGDTGEEDNMSEKANDILNQQLYEKMVKRNKDIEETIENLQKLASMLPIDIVKANDVSITRLQAALNKGKDYVINKFIDAQYGENLLFYTKLDTLYSLLCEQIDANLKKVKNDFNEN